MVLGHPTKPNVMKKSKSVSAAAGAAKQQQIQQHRASPAQLLHRELMEEHAKMKEEAAAARAKAMEREALRERLAALESELAVERVEKEHLRRVTMALRQRVNTVRSIAGTLQTEQQKFDAFTAAGRATAALRHPERSGESPFASMGQHQEAPKPSDHQQGRSAKRTAYCTDYANIRYLGEREDDAKEALHRKVEALLRSRGDGSASAPAAASSSSASPAGAGSLVLPPLLSASATAPSRTVEEVRGLSSLGYVGGDSRINLKQFHKRSTNRTRAYRDYEGKMVYMDTCDWPVTEGVPL